MWLLILSSFRNKTSDGTLKGNTYCHSLIKPRGFLDSQRLESERTQSSIHSSSFVAHFNDMPDFSCQILKETSGYQLMRRVRSLKASKLNKASHFAELSTLQVQKVGGTFRVYKPWGTSENKNFNYVWHHRPSAVLWQGCNICFDVASAGDFKWVSKSFICWLITIDATFFFLTHSQGTEKLRWPKTYIKIFKEANLNYFDYVTTLFSLSARFEKNTL